ncbi:transglutaminase domain-containing protein [Halorussus halobius]|uniref:transglutaminase domain-containing protein n=1 Tax=Halorussus halobius TaxID=1710537 RepID=UPI0010930E06|nr:transglutaminase domain-containing protein [Halorussus halobius]
MSEKLPTLPSDGDSKRDRLRALLTIACVVAVVLAGSVVPAISEGGLGRTPVGSAVPQHDVNLYGDPGSGGAGSGLPAEGSIPGGAGSGGGLGALNPGGETSVGGSMAGENATFRSQDPSVHFVVQSTAPAYWRTGAYDAYTGSGWERTGERRPYDGPIAGDGLRDREVEYRVTLNRSATALPSVWRPATLSGDEGVTTDSVLVTDRRAFATDDRVPAGASYSGVSHRPADDPDVLRTAGRAYPDELERRYTGLPDGTDELATFTDELTADADSPYDAAVRVESWLESTKNYSLDAAAPEGDVASEFVFEMEEGYCEYFATAMTAMLRTQDVPARYAVGYSTGQRVAPNTYEVREMNAHAWVEVYFPDVGWVTFDPTPGSERLQSEQRALANETGTDAGDYQPTEPGSPGERLSPNGSSGESTDAGSSEGAGESDGTPGDDGPPTADGTTGESSSGGDASTGASDDATATSDAPTTGESGTESGESESDGSEPTTTEQAPTTTASGEDSPDDDSSSDDEPDDDSPDDDEYDVALNRTPVPGATVTVEVSDGGSPAAGVAVRFDGERVGTTGEDGTVTAQVPYVENLTVTVADGGASTADDVDALGGGVDPPDGSGVAAVPPGLDAPMSLSRAPLRSLALDARTQQSSPAGDGSGGNGTEYELATDASLSMSGDVAVDSQVVVTATVEDVPVRNGTVVLDGERVASTDRRGRAEVRLPDAPGNATLRVERGPVAGETTVEIPRLNVSVAPALPLALPGTPVEVAATYGGEPASDARVDVAGATARTDFEGFASTALPFQSSADVVVSARGQTDRTTVSGLFANLAAVLGGAALVVGGLGYGARRRGYGPRRLAGLLVAGVRAVPGLAVALLFGVADGLERLVSRARAALDRLLAALRDLRAGESTVRELLARVRAWSGGLLGRLRAWLRERVRAARASATGPADESVGSRVRAAPDAPDRDADSYRTLREAWADFLGVVSVRDPESTTPGELAAHAIREDDLPAGAVVTLRDAFRDVEYGARSPADRLARIERAVGTIERAARPSPDESAGGDDPERGDGPERGGPAGRDAPEEATTPGGDD